MQVHKKATAASFRLEYNTNEHLKLTYDRGVEGPKGVEALDVFWGHFSEGASGGVIIRVYSTLPNFMFTMV